MQGEETFLYPLYEVKFGDKSVMWVSRKLQLTCDESENGRCVCKGKSAGRTRDTTSQPKNQVTKQPALHESVKGLPGLHAVLLTTVIIPVIKSRLIIWRR